MNKKEMNKNEYEDYLDGVEEKKGGFFASLNEKAMVALDRYPIIGAVGVGVTSNALYDKGGKLMTKGWSKVRGAFGASASAAATEETSRGFLGSVLKSSF